MLDNNFDFNDNQWQCVLDFSIAEDGVYELELPANFPLMLNFYYFPIHLKAKPNFHDFFEICYVYEGSGIFSIEEKTYTISKGDVFFVSKSKMHSIETFEKPVLRLVCISFLPEMFYDPATHDVDFEFLLPFYYHFEKMDHLIPATSIVAETIRFNMLKMQHELKEMNRFHKQALKVYLGNVLYQLLLQYEELFADNQLIFEDKYHSKRLKQVFDFISENYHQLISLEDIAEIVNLSKVYMSKYFKKVSGITITEYILNYRINAAKRLLIYSSTPISQIAYEVGFTSPNYFNRIFRRITSQSPSAFRKSYKS